MAVDVTESKERLPRNFPTAIMDALAVRVMLKLFLLKKVFLTTFVYN